MLDYDATNEESVAKLMQDYTMFLRYVRPDVKLAAREIVERQKMIDAATHALERLSRADAKQVMADYHTNYCS